MCQFSRSPGAFVVVGSFLLAPTAAFAQGISGEVTDNTGGVLPGVTGHRCEPRPDRGRTDRHHGQPGPLLDHRPAAPASTRSRSPFRASRRSSGRESSCRRGSRRTSTRRCRSAHRGDDYRHGRHASGRRAERPAADRDLRRGALHAADEHEAREQPRHLDPGFTGLADVGGRYSSQVGGSFHGKRGTKVAFDGMAARTPRGTAATRSTRRRSRRWCSRRAASGRTRTPTGPVVNIVPKEGSNRFSGIAAGFLANDSMESENLTAELQARGVTTSNQTLRCGTSR